MHKDFIEYNFTTDVVDYTVTYSHTKLNIGYLMSRVTDTNGYFYVTPVESKFLRGFEINNSSIFQINTMGFIKYSDNISWLFYTNGANIGQSTKRIFLSTYNKYTNTITEIGSVVTNHVAAVVHQCNTLLPSLEYHTSGTVSVSGNSVSGFGTSWITDGVCVGNRIGFGSTSSNNIMQWYQISSVINNTSLIIITEYPTDGSVTSLGLTNSLYVIEDLRIIYANDADSQVTNRGIYVVKGLRYELFTPLSTNIPFSTTVDNIRACYRILDSTTTSATFRPFGLILENKVSLTEQYLFSYTYNSATTFSIQKFNIRSSLALTAGRSNTPYLFTTGATAHGGGNVDLFNPFIKGTNGNYFLTSTTRVTRILPANIASASTNFVADTMREIPPGNTGTFTSNSSLLGTHYLPLIDRFYISHSQGTTKNYITPYTASETQFERVLHINDRLQSNTYIVTEIDTPVANLLSSTLRTFYHDGLSYITRDAASNLNVLYTLPLEADKKYHTQTKACIITPELLTPDNQQFDKVYIETNSGYNNNRFIYPTEGVDLYYRTSGIVNDTGTWSLISESGDISYVTGSSIQFKLAFETIGINCVSNKIYSLNLTYQSNGTPLSSAFYEPSYEHTNITTQTFAWRQVFTFTNDVPNLGINIYDTASASLILSDDLYNSINGTWEYSTNNGVTWSSYTSSVNQLDSYIRYNVSTPLSSGLKVKAILFESSTQSYTSVSPTLSTELDFDAETFLSVARISNPTIINAVNDLTIDIKAANIWLKMTALYPFVGASVFSHRFNLKNPNEFQLTFSGGWIHDNLGILMNNTNTVATTGVGPNNGNISISAYLTKRLIGIGGQGAIMGSSNTGTVAIRANATQDLFHNHVGLVEKTLTPASLRPYLGNSRVGTNEWYAQNSIDNINTFTDAASSISSGINIGNVTNTAWYGAHQLAFVHIGTPMTQADMVNLRLAVNKFQITLGRNAGVALVSDTDAQAFLESSNIIDITIANAVNQLVIDLKSANLWSKFKAIYPFVSGIAYGHKFNLKDPRDLDAAFRLVFNGTWTHDSSGVQANGINGYADTKLNPDTVFVTMSSIHISLYSISDFSAVDIDMGVISGGYETSMSLYRSDLGGKSITTLNATNSNSFTDANSLGFYLSTRTGNTVDFYKDDSLVITNSDVPLGKPTNNIFISNVNLNGSPDASLYSNKRFAFATIGDGLNATDALNFYNIVQSFQTSLNRSVGLDPDTKLFITATGLTDQNQIGAINSLVKNLKFYGIWSKLNAIYPFVGGTSNTHKYNLKDPRDLDDAYRLVFTGGWTHSSTGAFPNGTNAYAKTFLSTSVVGLNSGHMSYYSRTNTLPNSVIVEMGVLKSIPDSYTDLQIASNTNTSSARWNNQVCFTNATNTNSTGFYISNRQSSSTIKFYKNGSPIVTGSCLSSVTSTYSIFIGAVNAVGVGTTDNPLYFSPRECSFASIGVGLSDTESFNLYYSVQLYQIALGRQLGILYPSDVDARAFILTTGIENQTQMDAVNQLSIDLKAYSLWDKMRAIYPFIGGSASTHKFNLKDSRDLDAAYRLAFSGGWTHSSTGILPNGTNTFANTYFSTSLLTLNSGHISYYSRTVSTSISTEIGGGNPSPDSYTLIQTRSHVNSANTYVWYNNTITIDNVPGVNSAGFFIGTRTASNAIKLFRNANVVINGSAATNTTSIHPLYIGAYNNASISALYFGNKEGAFASIGEGLSDAEAANLNYVVQKYQNSLGRIIIASPTVSDSDAQAFLWATEITSVTQSSAINQLVIDLKTAGIWTKMRAIYPFVGGSATTHKFNLKDPRDADVAFRLVFNGGFTHDVNGIQGNGTNGYVETKFIPNSEFTSIDNVHISLYSRINQNAVDADMGVQTGSDSLSMGIFRSDFSNQTFYTAHTGTSSSVVDTNSIGFYVVNRIGTSQKGFKNAIVRISSTNAPTAKPTSQVFISNLNSGGPNAGLYSNKQFAFASIGDGLTDFEASDFYVAVEKYQTTLGRQIGVPVVSDSNAQTFLFAAEITSQFISSAINQLVVDLKTANLWSKMKAIYPFVGASANTHKYNLKDPRDTNDAFRLSFSGGYTHDNNGIQGNGTNAFADTFLIPNNTLSLNDTHISLYSRTNNIADIIDMGANDNPSSVSNAITFQFRWSDGNMYSRVHNETTSGTLNTNSQGFYIASRINSGNHKLFKNNTSYNFNIPSTARSIRPIYISAWNNTGGTFYYSNRQYTFASIGDGLTDTEASDFYNIVETFQTSLGRQIGSDGDAGLFIGVAGITNSTEKSAIQQLVSDLKTNNLWTKLEAIYPFVGGNANSHKYNLKNPQDTNSAFRLSFSGGWTHSSTGVQGNGTNAWANTFYNLSTNSTTSDISAGVYCRTNLQFAGIAFGAENSNLGTVFAPKWTDNNTYYSVNDNLTQGIFTTLTDTRGFFVQTRQAGVNTANKVLYRNGTSIASIAASSVTAPNLEVAFGARNQSGSIISYDVREYSFFFLGDNLTAAEVTNLTTIVQTFQTTLGRNV